MKEMKKNIFLQILYHLFSFLLPFITTPIIARSFGVDGLGEYSYAYTIMIYFSLFGMLGITTLGTRKVGSSIHDKDLLNNNFSNIYFVQVIFTVFVSVVYVLFSCFFTTDSKLYLLIGIYLLSNILDINWLFYGLEKFGVTVIKNTLVKVISFIFIILFVKSEKDIYLYALIISASFLISNVLLWASAKRYVSFVKIKMKEIKKLIIENFILFVPAIASSFFVYMDKILIGMLYSINDVGYYEAMDKVLGFPLAIVYAVMEVLYSKSVNLKSKNNYEERKKIFNSSSTLFLFFIFGVMFGLLAISSKFVVIYFGNDFKKVSILLNFAIIYLPFRTLRLSIKNQVLLPDKEEKKYIKSLLIGAMVNLILNVLLIPNYGALGAVIGTIFAESISSIILIFYARKYIDKNLILTKSFIFIVAAFVMFVSLCNINWTINNPIISLILDVLIGATIYITISFIFYKLSRQKHIKSGVEK